MIVGRNELEMDRFNTINLQLIDCFQSPLTLEQQNISETELDNYEFDYVINRKVVENLEKEINKF